MLPRTINCNTGEGYITEHSEVDLETRKCNKQHQGRELLSSLHLSDHIDFKTPFAELNFLTLDLSSILMSEKRKSASFSQI